MKKLLQIIPVQKTTTQWIEIKNIYCVLCTTKLTIDSLSPQYQHLISNWKLYLLVFFPYGELTFPFRFAYFLWKQTIKLISNGSKQNPYQKTYSDMLNNQ